MADISLVELLKEGAPKFNEWRRQRSKLDPIDLSGGDFRGMDLMGAELRGAILTGANLSRTNLRRSNLNVAKLIGADFTGANFYYSQLIESDLSDANLTKARMLGTYIRSSNVECANLTDAILGGTVFSNLNLSRTIGLETCRHAISSIVDHQTFQLSPNLPLAFLRGVGLPDSLIEYLPSLFNQAIKQYSCFISYSTKNQDFADRLYADLQNKGVRCWFAPDDMPIGGKILDEIDAAIRLRDKLLLILSEHSIKSDWVEDEVTKAFEEERKRGQAVLFPVRLDDAVMDTNEAWAAKLRARHIGDFRQWKDHDAYKKSFERVLRDLTVKKA